MNKYFIASILVLMLVFSFFPLTNVLAGRDPTVYGEGAEGLGPTGYGSPSGLDNPLPTADPRVIIGNVIRAMLGLVGSLALAVFVLGGFTWVTSAGNEEKIKKGKDMIMWAVFGLAVIFMSYAIVSFVISTLAGS
ncbi:MAG: pilin [Patescibacteria group bacterium]|jgi:hypothetical protein|nr:pilin [Patescibacteria group bacterium]